MKFPVAIEPGHATQAWGVVVPDLPGCFSASDMVFDEAIGYAHEAIEMWIETTLEMGNVIPKPSDISQLQKLKKFKGWKWAIVEFKL
jgi:predicted RNase H-like HicB family nuclease